MLAFFLFLIIFPINTKHNTCRTPRTIRVIWHNRLHAKTIGTQQQRRPIPSRE